MSYFTKKEARAAANASIKKQFIKKSFDQGITESIAAAKDTDRFDIFLSHSIQDAELVAGVIEILENLGLTVYVDWANDPQLDRKSVSKNTAAILRKRMRQCNSLVYVATNNASSSKWMPWELGYFDGYRPGQVAILPLVDTEAGNFPEQEYLGLYPVVTKDIYTNGQRDIFVEDFTSQWTTLLNFGKTLSNWKRYGK